MLSLDVHWVLLSRPIVFHSVLFEWYSNLSIWRGHNQLLFYLFFNIFSHWEAVANLLNINLLNIFVKKVCIQSEDIFNLSSLWKCFPLTGLVSINDEEFTAILIYVILIEFIFLLLMYFRLIWLVYEVICYHLIYNPLSHYYNRADTMITLNAYWYNCVQIRHHHNYFIVWKC